MPSRAGTSEGRPLSVSLAHGRCCRPVRSSDRSALTVAPSLKGHFGSRSRSDPRRRASPCARRTYRWPRPCTSRFHYPIQKRRSRSSASRRRSPPSTHSRPQRTLVRSPTRRQRRRSVMWATQRSRSPRSATPKRVDPQRWRFPTEQTRKNWRRPEDQRCRLRFRSCRS